MAKNNKAKYLVLISIHGLIRGHDLELGRDADTGGQIKYVVDLAKALAEQDYPTSLVEYLQQQLYIPAERVRQVCMDQ